MENFADDAVSDAGACRPPRRHAGARVGQWEGSVGEQTFRYCRPQENGNKLDTRWMALASEDGARGTLVVARGAPLSMSCHHFSPADDFGTRPGTKTPVVRHGGALVERDLTTVCVDGAHAGVGGIDSWGSLPLPQHRADAQCGGKCEWSFVLRPFSRGDGTIEEMAAEAKDRPNFEPLQLDES